MPTKKFDNYYCILLVDIIIYFLYIINYIHIVFANLEKNSKN